jgi:hypothetical protein
MSLGADVSRGGRSGDGHGVAAVKLFDASRLGVGERWTFDATADGSRFVGPSLPPDRPEYVGRRGELAAEGASLTRRGAVAAKRPSAG